MRATTAMTAMILLPALVAGCGSSVATGPGGTGGNGGNGGAGGSGGASTSTSTGTGGQCAGFLDAEGTTTTTVRFVNNSPMSLYLPGACTTLAYSIKPVSGDDGVGYVFEGGCLQTCERRQTQTPIQCGPCPEQVFLVPAGGSREVIWKGTGLRGGLAMPASCYAPGAPADATCSAIVAAAPGMYRVQVTGSSACGTGCTCNPDGVCQGTLTGMTALPNPTKFSFPEDGLVEVVFDTCAFGCPAP